MKTLILTKEKIEKYRKEFGVCKELAYTYNWKWTQEWAQKNIKPLLKMKDGLNLWYFFEFFIKDTVPTLPYWSLAEITYYIDLYKYIINKEKPNKIIFKEATWLDKYLLNQIRCETYYELEIKSKKPSVNHFIKQGLIFRMFFRLLLKDRTIKEQKDILIITNDRHTDECNETDSFFGNIAKELNLQRLKYKFIEYDRPYSKDNIKKMFDFYMIKGIKRSYIGDYYSFKKIKQIFKLYKEIKKIKKQLDNFDFAYTLKYNGIWFFEVAKYRLFYVFDVLNLYIADILITAQEIINQESAKVILLEHEKNFFDKAIIFYAKKHGIKTYCFEGELIYPKNNYLSHIKDKDLLNYLPDKKFVLGKYSYNWLKDNANYPAKILKIVGNHRC